ncbi:hypothetical protein FKG94_21440 [Exilibacterium tricleocarpae]|uniref:Calcium-binding protein n=1 Tax=Exilibacterium tricleocarpae TaxID=2591008 RepID=A0A545T031_9GAMM|nr:hypothetical protein [Exilibacterium tricleocarpae]TQV70586.1 hypothetical protein FKG94_21440 [Exilibacterium tricleocarpae]
MINNRLKKKSANHWLLGVALAGAASLTQAEVIIGNDLNSADSTIEAIAEAYSGNRGTNGGGDQSLQLGDVLQGTAEDDTIIGALGIDILSGRDGDDVLIGGTEDFNPFNRDRAFGDAGDDSFIWAPGDGNDFFNGGEGIDVLFMAQIAETSSGGVETGPVFTVDNSGDFDGIFLNEKNNPLVKVAGPGFCEIVEKDTSNSDALAELDLDHLVRFVLRGPRQAFNLALETDPDTDPDLLDSGLRIAIHMKSVEFLVCGSEIEGERLIFDLRQVPAQQVDISQLPSRALDILLDSDSFLSSSVLR